MRRLDVVLASPALAAVRQAKAQANRACRFLCSFPAGGIVDAAALQRPVVVEQHVGGNGVVAAQQLRHAAADGGTWMVATLRIQVAQMMAPQRFPAAEEIPPLC